MEGQKREFIVSLIEHRITNRSTLVRPIFSVIMPVFESAGLVFAAILPLNQSWANSTRTGSQVSPTMLGLIPDVREVLEEYRKRRIPRHPGHLSRLEWTHLCGIEHRARRGEEGGCLWSPWTMTTSLPTSFLLLCRRESCGSPTADMETIDPDNQPVRLLFRQPPDKEYFRTRNYMAAHALGGRK